MIPLEGLLQNFPQTQVLPVLEKRVRHGGKFNILLSQLKSGHQELPPGATTELESDGNVIPLLRVFSQQNKLIAIARAVVPRTYQPLVVFDPLP
jgi:hypothetical protein